MRSYSRYRSYSSLLTAHPMYSSIFWCRIYLSTDSSRSRYFSKSRPCRVCFFTATTSPKYFPMYTVEKAPSPTAGPIVTCNKTWVNRSRSSIYRAYEYDIRYLTWYICMPSYRTRYSSIPGVAQQMPSATASHTQLPDQVTYTRCSSNRNEFQFTYRMGPNHALAF